MFNNMLITDFVTPLCDTSESTGWENRPIKTECPQQLQHSRPVGEITRTIKKKQKRVRSAFTTDQLQCLEKVFSHFRYIDGGQRRELAQKLQIADKSIKIWFQNRRMKEKRCSESSYDSSHESFASSFYQNYYNTELKEKSEHSKVVEEEMSNYSNQSFESNLKEPATNLLSNPDTFQTEVWQENVTATETKHNVVIIKEEISNYCNQTMESTVQESSTNLDLNPFRTTVPQENVTATQTEQKVVVKEEISNYINQTLGSNVQEPATNSNPNPFQTEAPEQNVTATQTQQKNSNFCYCYQTFGSNVQVPAMNLLLNPDAFQTEVPQANVTATHYQQYQYQQFYESNGPFDSSSAFYYSNPAYAAEYYPNAHYVTNLGNYPTNWSFDYSFLNFN